MANMRVQRNPIESVHATANLLSSRQLMTMEQAQAEFLARNPNYDRVAVDTLRSEEYGRLDARGQIYLDYTGGGLHAESQLREQFALLAGEVLGNPHSHNPSSQAMTERVARARAYVLEFFNAPPEEYVVVFTPNASGALKLVGEAYPFTKESRFLLTFDNHNSVNGIREFACRRGAELRYVALRKDNLRFDNEELWGELQREKGEGNHLFAYPAQSNFSGVQHSLEWIAEAKEAGWDVLLDVAAFVPTNRLDLTRWKPDFTVLSFYKMFGYPTGLGCLLARRDALAKLKRPWFAGGTITIASVQGGGHYHAESEAAFEDGTIDYLNIPAVETGLRHLQRIGLKVVHERVMALTSYLLEELASLRHANGNPLVEIFGPPDNRKRGGTIAIAFLDPEGKAMDERRIEALAARVGISLRTGCFCNPGAGEIAHGLSAEQMIAFFRSGERVTFEQLRTTVRTQYGKSVASIRISVGIASNFADAFQFIKFARIFLNRSVAEVGEETDDCGCRDRGA